MRQIAIPAESTLAVQTRTAQMQDKVEQQHLKRLVLNYEQREEAEELKGTIVSIVLQVPRPHLLLPHSSRGSQPSRTDQDSTSRLAARAQQHHLLRKKDRPSSLCSTSLPLDPGGPCFGRAATAGQNNDVC